MEKLPSLVKCPVCKCSHIPKDKQLTNGVYAATCENCGHFFKFRATSGLASEITLTVNGQQYKVGSEYSASTSLNHFLRQSRASVGTKYMCTEGGCGMCVVNAKIYEPISDTKKSYAINSDIPDLAVVSEPDTRLVEVKGPDLIKMVYKISQKSLDQCLCPVFMCDGWEITTVEGLDDSGTNSIPKRLAEYNGSQCGFCSPAQVMNMYALLDYHSGAVTMQQVEDAFDGVICRCTGYRPILDAMKSFAQDSPTNKTLGKVIDIEELGKKICKKSGGPCAGNCQTKNEKAKQIILGDATWHKPTTIDELFKVMKQEAGKKIRLTFGNTGTGVYKQIGQWMYDVLIDLRGIRELYAIDFDPTIILGAGLSMTQLKDICFRGQTEPYFIGAFTAMYKMLSVIANQPVRNLGSWAGNLMLKHQFPDFPSDLYVTLEAADAQLQIADSNGPNQYTMSDFLKLDMTQKVIVCMLLPSLDTSHHIKHYKVAKRHQNAHSYVNAGIRMHLDKNNGYLVKEKPCIVFGGISKTFNHAVNTETYLTGKQLSDPAVLKGALSVLTSEVVPDTAPVLSSALYRKKLTLAMLYRYFLDVLGDNVSLKYRSGATPLERPLSSGQQSYGTKTMEWPVTEPMTKIEALSQTSGKAQYINDIPSRPGELSAAFVLSTVGNAKIQNIDPSEALKMPGVVKFLSAKDVPGENKCFPVPFDQEEVFCSGQVEYNGQAIGLIVAEDETTARSAAGRVKVTYTDVQPPIVNIADGIANKSFYNTKIDELVVGDAEGAISGSAKKISGSISMGPQYHFHMETQIAICVPTEDGMDVDASTQWMDFVQQAIAKICGVQESSIYVRVKRLGGAYGGKITRNFPVAAACGLAAHLLDRPVRLMLEFHRNMEMLGKRLPYQANYEVGFTNEGKLNGVKITYYSDCGISPAEHAFPVVFDNGDNAYHCDNWHMIPVLVKTNTPANTACRSPGTCPTIFIMESIMEHVAKSLGKDPTEVRKLNLYQQGQMTPSKFPLQYCNISNLVTSLENSASVNQRQQEIASFNQANRWKKKGLSVVPIRFFLGWNGANYMHELCVYSGDGSVGIATGGIESGQGLNTKVVQVAAYELGIPMNMIKMKPSNTVANANSVTTGGSITSELSCQAIIECCNQIKARMAPVKAKMTNPTWKQLVTQCAIEGVDLTARYWDKPATKYPFVYNSYGVTCTEVELDVLTGQHEITRVDMLYDCGESLNPEIDIGQAEGAFVMGLGYWLTEELLYDPADGQLVTNSTWEYKPPLGKDIPIDFRIQFLKNAPNPLGVLRSKAVGEPPLCMSCSALFALKHAVEAARKDCNQDTFFALNGPATVESLQTSCLLDPSQFVTRD